MSFRKMFVALSVVFVGICANLGAEDISSLKDEIMSLRENIAAIEAAQASATVGGAASLVSMKKKGAVTIGGRFDMDTYAVHRDDSTSGTDDVDSTSFYTTTAALMFRVQASVDNYLHIKLDVDDAWNGLQQDDLLEEVYFHWKNVGASPWALTFGKKEVPYGLDKDVAITKSYHHNTGMGCASYLGKAIEEADSAGNTHKPVGHYLHPGELDNVFQISGSYAYKDLAKLELTLFQNPFARGMHEDRSDDHLGLQSYAARVTLTPKENFRLIASMMNMHNDSMGDGDLRASLTGGSAKWLLPANSGSATTNQTSAGLAAEYKFSGINLDLFSEYQHGWNWTYDDELSVDIFSLGAIYGLRPKIDLIMIGEWMGYDTGNNRALFGWGDDEDYYKAQFAGKYKMASGVQLILEYTREWYFNERDGEDERQADVVAFRTMFVF